LLSSADKPKQPTVLKVHSGERIIFGCSKTRRVKWTYNKGSLLPGNALILRNTIIYLRKVEISNVGEYECSEANKATGENAIRRRFILQVYGKK